MEDLFLDHNNFFSLNKSVSTNFKYLKFLSIAINEITNLEPGVFEKMPDLKFLNLSSNRLQRLPHKSLLINTLASNIFLATETCSKMASTLSQK